MTIVVRYIGRKINVIEDAAAERENSSTCLRRLAWKADRRRAQWDFGGSRLFVALIVGSTVLIPFVVRKMWGNVNASGARHDA